MKFSFTKSWTVFLTVLALTFSAIGVTRAHANTLIAVNSPDDSIAVNGFCTLREAIQNANNDAQTNPDCTAGSGADTIAFTSNMTITLGSQLPIVTSNITINGVGAAYTFIEANAFPDTATYRVFEVSVANGDLTLNNLTVRNGRCNGSCSTDASNGGGILNWGALTVTNSTFSGNVASVSGGGIYNASSGTLNVTSATFTGNNTTTGNGGGIYNNSPSTNSVTNSIFSGNTATSGSGGGIFNDTGRVLTVTGSMFNSNNTAINGGGIYNNAGALTVTSSLLDGNSATYEGGGISNPGGTLTVTNSTLSNNSAGYNGGGIFSDGGTLNITSATFTGNTAASGGSGGGIFNNSPSMSNITGSTFSGNMAASGGGGGVYNNASSLLTVTNSAFNTNNTVAGGGIYNGISGQLTVTNSTFAGNSASSVGGGIINGGTLNITNSTFGSNSATIYGGGIENEGNLNIRNTTFSGNSSASGGGIANAAALNYSNTIIANSTAGGDCVVVGGAIGSNDNNLVEDASCSASLSGDPKLGPLANNDGSTHTFALLTGSPAINTGNDGVCTNPPVNGLDQRGRTRPQGAHCDIGSYEADATLTVKSTGAQDGWILESTETSNVGGTMNSASTTFYLGDGVADKQYRAILSFNTGPSLLDTAVITKVTLTIKRPATGYLVGNNNPFTWGLGLKADVCKNRFGTTSALQLGDFNYNNAANCKLLAGTFGNTPTASWYSANILNTAFSKINKIGLTQFRLRFAKDDNNDNLADYMKFYSGNAPAASRPQLIIQYFVP